MKFGVNLSAHITPEWRKQYISYEELKARLYEAIQSAPSIGNSNGHEARKDFFSDFEDTFFQLCSSELLKINNFFSEKLAEAKRKFTTLKMDLQVFKKNATGKVKGRKLHDVKMAFSEFYLSLILVQNYQSVNFTGFRKILKKHDKLLECCHGAEWRMANVEKSFFHTSHDVLTIISDTEQLFINELENGNRSKAMNRLRVPPLGAQADHHPYSYFRFGFNIGCFVFLIFALILSALRMENTSTTVNKGRPDWEHAIQLFRGPALCIFSCILLGVNTYGWRHAGVNHVLIFNLDPRDNLSAIQILDVASFLAVCWTISVLGYIYSDYLSVSKFIFPLLLIVFLILLVINPIPIFHKTSRRWLLRVLWRIMAAPFYAVNFSDFWLADQLNSLSLVFMDIEYFICFYIFESGWAVLDTSSGSICGRHMFGIRAILSCLPPWFRFAQCLRRYRDTRMVFPHLVNAGKYSSSFFVILFSALYGAYLERNPNASSFGSAYFYLWMVCAVVNSSYAYTWDIKMDWGLLQKDAGDNKFLRNEIVYSPKRFYYITIITNFVLRFSWTLAVSMTVIDLMKPYGEILKTIFSGLEVFRRFLWNFFRLENEHLNNCGQFRAVRDIGIKPIFENDDLQEQMYDESPESESRIDHCGEVRHRSSRISTKEASLVVGEICIEMDTRL